LFDVQRTNPVALSQTAPTTFPKGNQFPNEAWTQVYPFESLMLLHNI